MRFAIFLQHYFPYGGLQRDAVRLAKAAIDNNDSPTLVVSSWDGPLPDDIPVEILHSGGTSNHSKASRFINDAQNIMASGKFDTSIGFSRIPHAPFHFCGDACFLERFKNEKPSLLRWLPRYHFFLTNEEAVFGSNSATHLFFLAPPEVESYRKHYHIPPARYTLLPPWLSEAKSFDSSKEAIRQSVFEELSLPDEAGLLLFVGSNFKLKRVDHIIQALEKLPDHLHLAVCGQDDPLRFKNLAQSLHIDNRIHFLGARNDIPRLMTAADILIHPSARETAGMVLVEALTYGLPVLCTESCGYACYIKEAGGSIIHSDAPIAEITENVSLMLDQLPKLRQKAIQWAKNPKLYQTSDTILQSMRDSLT